MLGMSRVTYIIKPIVDNSDIFGLFLVRKVEGEIVMECMEIIGEHYRVLRYIRKVFF